MRLLLQGINPTSKETLNVPGSRGHSNGPSMNWMQRCGHYARIPGTERCHFTHYLGAQLMLALVAQANANGNLQFRRLATIEWTSSATGQRSNHHSRNVRTRQRQSAKVFLQPRRPGQGEHVCQKMHIAAAAAQPYVLQLQPPWQLACCSTHQNQICRTCLYHPKTHNTLETKLS